MKSRYVLFIAVFIALAVLAFGAAAQADSILFQIGTGGNISVSGSNNGQLSFSSSGISLNNVFGSSTPQNAGSWTPYTTIYGSGYTSNTMNLSAGNGTYDSSANSGNGSWTFTSGNFNLTTSNGSNSTYALSGNFSASDPLTINGGPNGYETVSWTGTSDTLNSTLANYFGVNTGSTGGGSNFSLYEDTPGSGMDFTSDSGSGDGSLGGTRLTENVTPTSASEAASLWILGVGLFGVVLAGRQYL